MVYHLWRGTTEQAQVSALEADTGWPSWTAFLYPAFLLSFAATCTWAEHHYNGDAQAPLAALEPALIVAAILTILCCIYLVRWVGKEDNEYWPRKHE